MSGRDLHPARDKIARPPLDERDDVLHPLRETARECLVRIPGGVTALDDAALGDEALGCPPGGETVVERVPGKPAVGERGGDRRLVDEGRARYVQEQRPWLHRVELRPPDERPLPIPAGEVERDDVRGGEEVSKPV